MDVVFFFLKESLKTQIYNIIINFIKNLNIFKVKSYIIIIYNVKMSK